MVFYGLALGFQIYRDRVYLLIIGAEGLIVHIEEKDITVICVACDDHILCYCGVGGCRERVVWYRQAEIVLSVVSGLALCTARRAAYILAFAVIVRGGSGMRHGIGVGVFIIDGCQSERVSRSRTVTTYIRTHPNRRVRCASRGHNDIGTLTNTESDDVGRIWLDRHKVVGDNRHVETINGETLNGFSTVINEPKSMLLAGVELEFGKAGV